MNEKELEERVDEILLKRTRGDKLTKQEEKILAYGYYAADRRSVRIRVMKRQGEEDRRPWLDDRG